MGQKYGNARKKTTLAPSVIDAARNVIQKYPKMPTRKLDAQLKISQSAATRCVKKSLGLKCYRTAKGIRLTQKKKTPG